jgi:hypothetical protein
MIVRSTEQRRHDALYQLCHERDVRVATASPKGVPHLVPVSLCWVDGRVIVAVPRSSPTAKNVGSTGRARLAIGNTRDVLMIDAEGVIVPPEDDSTSRLLTAFHERTGWNVAVDPGDYVILQFTPRRMQAWRNVEEISGREILGDGTWLA